MTEDDVKTGYPFQESVDKLRREFERLLEVAMEQGGRALDKIGLRTAAGPWIPLVDMIETPEEITVLFNLPGVDPESVDLHVAGNMLTISGEAPKAEVGEDEICYCFHISKRKILNFIRIHEPQVPSQISECGGAGTGCGWCIPFLKKYFAQVKENQPDESVDLTPEEYAKQRGDYIRAGKGTPPAGATPPPE